MECNVLGDSHLLHEVCRVEPGHDAVVPGGGQELVEGDGLAAEVVLQSNDIYYNGIRIIIALAKNAGRLQNGSHILLSLLPSFAKQA